MSQSNQKSLLRLLLLAALAVLLFHAPFWLIAPFKWFEVFFHEISHGLAALLTGGSIDKIDIQYDGSGTCYYRGGYRPVITFSGYAGAALWGWVIYEAGHASRHKTSVLLIAILLTILLVSGVLRVRDMQMAYIMMIMSALLASTWRFGSLVVMMFFVVFIGIFLLFASIRSPVFLCAHRSM